MIFLKLGHLCWILMEILTVLNILDTAVFFLDRMLQLVTHLFKLSKFFTCFSTYVFSLECHMHETFLHHYFSPVHSFLIDLFLTSFRSLDDVCLCFTSSTMKL
jgi:hypothetical protein